MRKNTAHSLLSCKFPSLSYSYSVYTHSQTGEIVKVFIPNDTKTVIEAI